jgi:hypothetical protein
VEDVPVVAEQMRGNDDVQQLWVLDDHAYLEVLGKFGAQHLGQCRTWVVAQQLPERRAPFRGREHGALDLLAASDSAEVPHADEGYEGLPANEMIERVDEVIAARESAATESIRPRLTALRQRLRQPVRIAVVGRVKAGKSTVVNALLAQQVAPTDISECTRVVTWFHYGHPQRLVIEMRDGTSVERQLSTSGHLPEELGVPVEQVTALHAYLTNESLRSMTLIDTPGIGSVHREFSESTEMLLKSARDTSSATGHADAVVFLLNQVMMEDELATLRMFREAGGESGHGSAANAVGVLSRADQISDGSRDPWEVALELAGHFSGVFRGDVATVVPVIGLLAEAAEAATLQERDMRPLRELAALGEKAFRRLTWSADRFVTAESDVSEADRERLLGLLDLYGVRRAVALVREGTTDTVPLRRLLSAASGVAGVKATMATYFNEQDHVLKVRSVLQELNRLSFAEGAGNDPVLTRLRSDVETLRLDPAMHAVAELEAWHDCNTGRVELDDDTRAEIGRLFAPGTPKMRLGIGDTADPADSAKQAMLRWRAFMNTDATPGQARVARVVLRSYQLLWKELTA